MNPPKDETGRWYGRLFVERKVASRKGYAMFECVCDCGKRTIVAGAWLRAGNTSSCGCAIGGTASHGHSCGHRVTRTYESWTNMKTRCSNPNVAAYKYYGARGVKVCKRWLSFSNFLADMGECPDGYSIERINVNGNYTPKNCKWIPLEEQSKNRRSSSGQCKNR